MTKTYDISKTTISAVPTVTKQSYGSKGRTAITYQNKLRKITKFYNHLYKKSQESKTKYGSLPKDKQTRKKPFFCDKYPDVNTFLKVNPLNKPNKTK